MKKILALLLTLLLVLGMSTVAFADDTGDDSTPTENPATYTDATTVIIKKSYKLEGAGTSPAETFTLQQVGDGIVKTGDATTAPALGTITGAAFTEGGATAEGAEQNITIELPTYDSVGIYEYTLKEVAGTTAGVTYYANDIKLVVTVINDANGNLRIGAVHTEAEDGDKSDTFENTYSAGTLKITKTVTGNLGDKDKYFEFTVTLTGENGKSYGERYTVSSVSNASNPTAIVIGTPATFYLKDGETISIANLPYGVTYAVEEKDYTGEGYTTEKTGDSGTIESAEATAAFTNDKSTTIDTGITTDSLPYIMLLGIVMLIGAAMLLKRRVTEN